MAAGALTPSLPSSRKKKGGQRGKNRKVKFKGTKMFFFFPFFFYAARDTSPRNFHVHFIGQDYNMWLAIAVREAGKLSMLFSSLFRGGTQGKRKWGMNVEQILFIASTTIFF